MSKRLAKDLMRQAGALGSLPSYIFIMLLFAALGAYALAMDLFVGVVIAYLVTIAIRLAYPRDRPIPDDPKGLIGRIDAASFPSLHSYRTGLLFLVPLHYWSLPLGILFLALALIVWYMRYARKRHHISDIAAGAALGIVTALAIL